MSDQASAQSPQDLPLEDRFAAYVADEVPEEEQAAPQDNVEEAEETDEPSTPEGEQAEPEAETDEPDLVEIEVEGEHFRVPEKLKEKIMLQADYTRKTQEVAEQRKQLEYQHQQLQQAAVLQQQSIAEYAQLVSLDNQLQAYQNVDWNSLYDSDPAEFVKLKESRRDLIDSRNSIAGQIQAKQQQHFQQQQQQVQQIVEEGQKILAKEIPAWSAELAGKLNNFAINKFGFTAEEVGAVTDPRVVKLLHKAYLYDQQQSGKPIAEKRVQNLPKVSKPGSPNAKSAASTKEAEARKLLKKTGSDEALRAVFLARYS